MKTKQFLWTLITVCVMWTLNGNAQGQNETKKILIAYFSWSGNTQVIAKQIQELTGGELFEIQTAKPYPEEYRPCTEVAKKEKEANARPALKTKPENLDAYDIIFVGYPNWWGTAPMVIWSFLENYDLEGKTVIPFCTHGGGGEQNCFKDFVHHTGKAETKKGFITNGSGVKSARPQVEKWLHEIMP